MNNVFTGSPIRTQQECCRAFSYFRKVGYGEEDLDLSKSKPFNQIAKSIEGNITGNSTDALDCASEQYSKDRPDDIQRCYLVLKKKSKKQIFAGVFGALEASKKVLMLLCYKK